MSKPARYSTGFVQAASINPGAAYAEMVAGATKSISVVAVKATADSGAGGSIALVRAFAVGTGAGTGTYSGVAHKIASTGSGASGKVFGAWAQQPTGFVGRLQDVVLGAATGTHRELWRIEDGPIVLEPGQSLLAVNQGSGINGGGIRFNFTWDEGPI